jgi:DNA-binding NarL/FixJ family response regulator
LRLPLAADDRLSLFFSNGSFFLMPTLYLIDDLPVVREGYRSLMDPEPDLEIVGANGSAPEALAEVRRLKPDLILVEVDTVGVDLNYLRDLARSGDDAALVLTRMRREQGRLPAAVREMAAFVLDVNDSPVDVLRAVHSVLGSHREFEEYLGLRGDGARSDRSL